MSRRRRDKPARPIATVSVTPLCDVSLVLLIMLMVITPFIIQASVMEVSRASSAGPATAAGDEEHITIHVTGSSFYLGHLAADNAAELEKLLRSRLDTGAPSGAVVSAGSGVALGRVVSALDTARRCGIEDLFLKGGSSLDR